MPHLPVSDAAAPETPPSVAVIGTGPAGLMAATALAAQGIAVTIFEKRPGAGRKLLIAGSSGLNISYDCPEDRLPEFYTAPAGRMAHAFAGFSRGDWLRFIEKRLGLRTFLGTSRRYFVEEMKAAGLLQAWTQLLREKGVTFRFRSEVTRFDRTAEGMVRLETAEAPENIFSCACFCLGGGSWEPEEKPLRWPSFFIEKGLRFHDFRPSNVGYQVRWPEAFLQEAEGKPLKNVRLSSSRGTRAGDLVVTRYGIEGTPVYFAGMPGEIRLDLKPDLELPRILERLAREREKLAPLRKVRKHLKLPEASLALLFHLTPPALRNQERAIVERIKSFPLLLEAPQPLDEAISAAGGLAWEELTEDLMLTRFPGVFAAGEMLDWDAPTGGFLIQGCVSQGAQAAAGILRFLGGRQ